MDTIVALLDGDRFAEALTELEQSKVLLTLKDEAFTCRAPKGFIQGELQRAMARGRNGLVQALREAAQSPNRWGRLLLHRAAAAGVDCEVQRQLTNGADLNARDRHRQTPLFLAAEHGHDSTVELLLAEGADPDLADLDHRTPLFVAVAGSRRRVVDRLIAAGADLNRGSFLGMTPLALSSAPQNRGPSLQSVLLQAGAKMEDEKQYDESERIFLGTVIHQLESFSEVLRRHSIRVANAAAWCSATMNWAPEFVGELRLYGLLHDLGKAQMDPVIRDGHPDQFEEEQRQQWRAHAWIGEQALSGSEIPVRWKSLPSGVRHHHERWDGGGFPDGLKGEDIPPGSRILAVLDRFERLMELADDWQEAYGRLEQEAGTLLDPAMVEAFRPMAEEVAELYPPREEE